MTEQTACPYCGLQDHTGREHFQFAMSLSDAATGGSPPIPSEATRSNAPSSKRGGPWTGEHGNAMRDTCPLNRCGRPLGIGTHMSLAAGRDGRSHQTIAVCEEHWQVLRPILPAEPAANDGSHAHG